MNIIELSKINKFFGTGDNRIHVLRDIDLSISAGDFVSIIGQSGSGKSTLMNIIGCLDTPSSGSYKIKDIETSKCDDDSLAQLRSKTFGFIFQKYNLLTNLNTVENVALPAIYLGVDEKEREIRAKQLLDELELASKYKNKPNELSGGQQQRVSIARALMNGGEVILADEPTGALDSKSGKMVMEIIKKLHSFGHTIILVTHDPKIADMAHRVIEIADGQIVSDKRKRKSDKVTKALKSISTAPEKTYGYIRDRFKESFRMAMQSIMTHKMRSILTMVGIILGVTSLVTVVSLGRGSQDMIVATISEMGSNTIGIYPGKTFGDDESDKIKTLVPSDAEFLAKQPYIDSSTPEVSSTGTLVYENFTGMAHMAGIGNEYFNVTNIKIVKGRGFTKNELETYESVVVIDEKTATELFKKGRDPIGKILMFNKKPLKVIGVARPPAFMMGQYANMLTLYAPYTVAMKKITGEKSINSITVKIRDDVPSAAAEKDIVKALTARHGVKDFFTMSSDSIQQTVKGATDIMTLLVAGIALISLLVGGVGVMNIMLVSVTERTKEIGIRMAIGASKDNILEQFLIESIIICLIGGLIGVSIAAVISLLFNMMNIGISMRLYSDSIVIALGCVVAIGVVFGFIPARNASRLNPIQALARD